MIILAEMQNDAGLHPKKLALEIRQAVSQDLDCTPADVRIVPDRWLVKSSAGKMARKDNRIKYLEEFAPTRQKA